MPKSTAKTTEKTTNLNRLNGLFLILAAGVLAASMIYVGAEFVRSNKDNQQTSQWITNTVSVMGEGKAYVIPDTLIISAMVLNSWFH